MGFSSFVSLSKYGITCSHLSFSAVCSWKWRLWGPQTRKYAAFEARTKERSTSPANNRIAPLGHTWEDSKIIVIPLTFPFIYAPEHMAPAAPSMVPWEPFQALVAPGGLRCSSNLLRSWRHRWGWQEWQEHLQGRDSSQQWKLRHVQILVSSFHNFGRMISIFHILSYILYIYILSKGKFPHMSGRL